MMERILYPVLFAFVAICAVFGLLMMQVSAKGNELQTADAPDGTDRSAFAMAAEMLLQDLSGSVTVQPDIEILGYLPDAPEGWTAAPYENAHGEAITQATLIRSNIAKSSTNSLLTKFDEAARGRKNAVAQTYMHDGQQVAVLLSVPDQLNPNTVRGGIMTALSANMAAMDFGDIDNDTFAIHHGIAFKESSPYSRNVATSDMVPVDYRKFSAHLSGIIKITILTNASDADVATVLEGIDMAGLIGLLPEPEPHMLVSTDFSTREAELSTHVPGPTLARKAYLILKTDLSYSRRDRSLLQAMESGRIKDWPDMYDDYGTADAYSPDVLALLGQRPVEPADVELRIRAKGLNGTDRDWNDAEQSLLRLFTREGAPETDRVQRVLDDDDEPIAPEIMALVALVPAAQEIQGIAPAEVPVPVAAAAPSGAPPVIRRGTNVQQGEAFQGNCDIQNGVRRCILGSQ